MFSNVVRGALVAALALGWVACSTPSTQPADSSPPAVDGPRAVDGSAEDTGPPCTYPAGPYGTTENEVVKNMEFDGFADPSFLCKPSKDQVMDLKTLRKISLQDFYCSTGCPKKKRRLLWVMVSAGWCGPCQKEVAATQAEITAGNFDTRVHVLDIVYEDDKAKPVTEAFAKVWAKNNKFELHFPVVMDPTFRMSAYFNRDAVPFNMLVELDTMKIVFRQVGENLPAVGQAMFNYLNKK